jgi:WD40 repeat protein
MGRSDVYFWESCQESVLEKTFPFYVYHVDDAGDREYLVRNNDDCAIWNIRDKNELLSAKLPCRTLVRVAWEAKELYTASSGVTRKLNLETREPISNPMTGDKIVTFSPEGQLLFTLDEQKEGRIWDTSTGQLLAGGLWQANEVNSAKFDASGRYLRTFTLNGEILTWDLSPDQRPAATLNQRGQLLSQRKITSGGVIANLSVEEMVALWRSRGPQGNRPD